MAKKKISTTDIAKVLKDSAEFTSWKLEVDEMRQSKAGVNKRMDFALAGIQIGILPTTAVTLCGVFDHDLERWLDSDPQNSERMMRAAAFAEAKLEFIVHKAAERDPYLALSILEKRNPKRWEAMEREDYSKSVVKGKKMSSMLSSNTDNKAKLFDVATDVEIT